MTTETRSVGNGYCSTCGLWWTGKLDCHCAACCVHFTSERAFDKHQRLKRDGSSTCLDPQFVKGLEPTKRAGITAWKRAGEAPYDLFTKAQTVLERG